jgi:hypothetical protein
MENVCGHGGVFGGRADAFEERGIGRMGRAADRDVAAEDLLLGCNCGDLRAAEGGGGQLEGDDVPAGRETVGGRGKPQILPISLLTARMRTQIRISSGLASDAESLKSRIPSSMAVA